MKKNRKGVFVSPIKTHNKIYRVMKLTLIALFIFTTGLFASVRSQNARVNIHVNDVKTIEVLTEIEKQTDYLFIYNKKEVDLGQKVSMQANDKSVAQVLATLFEGTNVMYKMEGNNIMLMKKEVPSNLIAQQGKRKITGTVIDASGVPVIGANIMEKGTTNGTITDLDGKFTLEVAEGATLQVSYIGYVDQNINVGNQKSFNIRLAEDTQDLDEVVVVGYGVQKKKLITGATLQLKGDEMQKLSAINPVSAIQSMSPGISITQNNGLPDSGYKMYIRGIGTIGNASPLVIIDGTIGGDLNSLNPSDIESIDVLKDAASSAIYGARAANGVVIVTTKQGKLGKATVSYDGYFGVQNVQKMLHTVDAQTYVSLLNEAQTNEGLNIYDYASLVPNWDDIQSGRFKGTEWIELFRNKNAPIQNHSFNITGGSERQTYSLGFSYTSQEAIFGSPVNPRYDRYTARINSNYIIMKNEEFDIIKFGENILFNHKNKKGRFDRTGDPWSNDFSTMFQAPPFLPVKDEEGNYSHATNWYSFYANPIGYYDYNSSGLRNNSTSLMANAYLEIQPIKNLILKSSYTYNYSHSANRAFYEAFNLGGNMSRTDNEVQNSQGYSTGFVLENTINYKFSVKEKNHFDILIGQSIQKEGIGFDVGGNNVNPIFTGIDYAYLSNAKQIIPGKTGLSGSPGTQHQIASFFGRINYDFNETYLLSLIMRADGSSNFARGHRWGYFPSVSAGWVISNEGFMDSTKDWLDLFKLRASYGQNGNESISNFQYLSTVSFSGADYYFGTDKTANTIGAYFDILPNEDVSWETSEQINVGFDSRFINNRLGVTFDYYLKNTKDWLVQAPTLSSNGTGAPYINGGDIRNTGFELSASWNDNIGDFRYGISGNWSFNKNEVTRIANSEGIIYGTNGLIGAGFDDIYRAEVGYPVAYFLGYKSLGIFQTQEEIDNYKGTKLEGVQPGDMIWVDTNNDGILDTNDRTMIGNPHPKFRFGLNMNFAYKGFDLLISGYGVAGNDILQNHRSWNDLPYANFTTDIAENRWHGPGTSTKYPRLSSAGHTNWRWISDQYLENGSFFRIDNVTIGYDFKYLLKDLPLQQARLYVTAQNLYTITGYTGMDPEIGFGGSSWAQGIDYGQVPRPRTFLVGVNLKF